MHKDLTSVLLEHMQEGVELILKEMIQKYSVYCIRSRKRLRWQLQTFETAVANVCDRGCKRLRFSSTNVRVTRPPVCHKADLGNYARRYIPPLSIFTSPFISSPNRMLESLPMGKPVDCAM